MSDIEHNQGRNPAGAAPDTIEITVGREITFAELLDRLGHRPDEMISLCSDCDGVFRCVGRPYVKRAPQVVSPPQDGAPGYTRANCWFSINTIREGLTRGRGKEEDTARLAVLTADLDFAEGKCSNLEVGVKVANDLAAVMGQPVAVTDSGHGLHPYWSITDGTIGADLTHEDAKALVTRFGALVVEIAGRHGAKVKVDGVFDLARVMRVPGTLNIKPGMEPVEAICYEGTGEPLTLGQVRRILDEHGIPEHPVKKPAGGASTAATDEEWSTEGKASPKVLSRLALAMDHCHALSLRPDDASRHGNVRDDVLALVGLGKRGQPGVSGAVNLLHAHFVAQIGPDRAGGEAEAEREFTSFLDPARIDALLDDDEPEEWTLQGPDHKFWKQTPILAHILQFARAQLAPPYCVLDEVMRRAVGCIEPNVVLPATVGGVVSLNLASGLVGGAGTGKDIGRAAGRRAVGFRMNRLPACEAKNIRPGSGEGFARSLMPDDSPNSGRALLCVSDVSVLEALADRKGQTLAPMLLAAYMGQPLGFQNNNKQTTTVVEEHSYRLCLSVGVQLGNDRFFSSREKDGLPHRFLWLPTIDRNALRERPRARPQPLDVPLPAFRNDSDDDRIVLEIPSEVTDAIWEHQWRVRTGDPDVEPLDGHAYLTRLKVAAALSILHGHQRVTLDAWGWAGHLMDVSDRTRAELRKAADDMRHRENAAQAHQQADREEVLSDRKRERCKRAVERWLDKAVPGAQISRHDLRGRVKSDVRSYFDDVVTELIDAGRMSEVGSVYPIMYQKGPCGLQGPPSFTCEKKGWTDGPPSPPLTNTTRKNAMGQTKRRPPPEIPPRRRRATRSKHLPIAKRRSNICRT